MAPRFGRGGDQVVTQRDTWEAELLGLGRAFVFICPLEFISGGSDQALCFLTNGTQYGLLVDDIDITAFDPTVTINYKMILNPTFVDTANMAPGVPVACNRTKPQSAHIASAFFLIAVAQVPPTGGTVIWNGNVEAGGGQGTTRAPKILLATGDSILLTLNTGVFNIGAAAIKFHHV